MHLGKVASTLGSAVVSVVGTMAVVLLVEASCVPYNVKTAVKIVS